MTPKRRPRNKHGRFITDGVSLCPYCCRFQFTDNGRQDTTDQAQREAVTHVLENPELLESILLLLPMRDLLLSQRVCTTWRTLINTSIKVRRALFLEPAAGVGNVSFIDWRLDDKDFYKNGSVGLEFALPLRGFDGKQKPKIYKSHWGRTREDAGQYRVFVNPLLSNVFPFLGEGIYDQEKFADLPLAMQHFEASWQGMYFTQPPVNLMAYEYDSEVDELSDWSVSSLQRLSGIAGVRMIDLYATLVQIGRPAWIEGRLLWEKYDGVQDLARIITRRGTS